MRDRGVVIFATNNGTIDYVKLAEQSAKNIERHLGLPTTIIQNDTPVDNGSKRWFADYGETVKWHNANRCSAWLASPYEETILLDADYVVASDQLNLLFDSGRDFLCHRQATNIADERWSNDSFGVTKFPMWWATVVYFKRTDIAKTIFHAWRMVEQNYEHYANLYNFKRLPFRNDYALSIAIGIATGHHLTNEFDIPWPLTSVMPEHDLSLIAEDSYEVQYKQNDRLWRLLINGQDFHAMGKKHLENLYAS